MRAHLKAPTRRQRKSLRERVSHASGDASGDVDPRGVPLTGQHGSGDPFLAVPTDDVAVSENPA
jgi:hypothetical protein